MGVHGLTTYIAENSKKYLEPYKLHDCHLVIDGNNVACNLYNWQSKSDSAFGGDYDEYSKVVRDFFLALRRCNVTPIVLFDGGYEKKKFKTVLYRAGLKLPILRGFAARFSTAKFFPLFMVQAFCDVLEDLRIFCIRCDLEADVEIASVARALNCPVMSYDSDFYIYNVLYIPFDSVYLDPVKFEDSNHYYLKCSLYEVTNFVKEFQGLDKSMMPILATLLGNDYVDNSIFQKFFSHVIIYKDKKKSYTQRRIHGVLHWLKKENVDSAIKLILSHLENRKERLVLKAIETSVNDYNSSFVSEAVINELTTQLGSVKLEKKDFEISLPPEIINLYSHCKINKFIMDVIMLGIYFTPMQVEDVQHQSSHSPSLQLIRDLLRILTPYLQEKEKCIKVYLTIKNHYTAVEIDNNSESYLSGVYLHQIIKESKQVRLKWLCKIVGVDEEDLSIVSGSNWSIFIMSFIYWIRSLNKLLSFAHIHALILMAIVNEAVQKYVGYFRNYSKFMRSKKTLLESLKETPIQVADCKDFNEMIASVTLYEKLIVQGNLIPFRQTTEKAQGKAYSMSTVHLFACFQSCLFHIMQVNALLNYPLPYLKISDFYSGTLLFNFFLIIKSKPQVDKFGLNLFKDTPNLARIYTYLCEGLCKYLDKSPPVVSRVKKRKKKSRQNKGELCEEKGLFSVVEHGDDDDGEEYTDESNLYAMLHNVRV